MQNVLARATVLALALVSAASLSLVSAPAPALAAVVPGASYSGVASDYALVSFTVAADGTSITSYSITGAQGNTCTFNANGVAGSWLGTPIVNGAFDYTIGSSFTFEGSFAGPQTASGTFQFTNVAEPPEVPACETGNVNWSATATLTQTVTGNPGEAGVAAGQPLAGANCDSTDGKISGRGSTLQLWMQYDLASGYANSVCGDVGAEANSPLGNGFPDPNLAGSLGDPTDPDSYNGATFVGPLQATNTAAQAGQDWMVSYNDYSAQSAGATGSSNGKTAISCRTDAFGASDIPYVTPDWNAINGAPTAESPVTGTACYPVSGTDTYTSPFQAVNANVASDPQGSAGTGLMSFPIGGSAVELAANLTKANCGTGNTLTPTTLKLTALDVSNVMGGIDTQWDDLDRNVNGATDLGENPNLAECTEAIVRVSRNDTAGTSQALLNYLRDAAPGDAVCSTANANNSNWTAMQADAQTAGDLNNDIWPGEDGTPGHPAPDTLWPAIDVKSGCSGITQAGSPGGPNLLQVLHNQPGGVGYDDYADVKHDTSTNSGNGEYLATLIGSTVANSATGAQTAPSTTGGASNCSLAGASLPGAGNGDYVGLNDDWALDNPINTDDVAFKAEGATYPICTLTWVLVWGGEDGNTAGVGPEPELNADQVRTLYSYFTYVLTDPAQTSLKLAGYAPLPESIETVLRGAFQQYF